MFSINPLLVSRPPLNVGAMNAFIACFPVFFSDSF